uniref:Uncharacterized protein n=1 Tax=Opuntia streptacantha TaxID=393608 RepID=A0A7C9E3X7_OPUST
MGALQKVTLEVLLQGPCPQEVIFQSDQKWAKRHLDEDRTPCEYLSSISMSSRKLDHVHEDVLSKWKTSIQQFQTFVYQTTHWPQVKCYHLCHILAQEERA